MNKKTMILATVLPLAMILTTSVHAAITPINANTSDVISVDTKASDTSATPVVTTSANAEVGTAPTTADGKITSTQVTTDADLNAYTAAALASDTSANIGMSSSDTAEIKDVSYPDNGVTVNFTQPAKFLGLFPTSIDAQVVVKADGSTTVSYPWYSFLVRKHSAAINNIFQTQVTEATGGKAVVSASASDSMAPQTKALIVDAIRQTIHGLRSKAAVNADASASTSTSATAQ